MSGQLFDEYRKLSNQPVVDRAYRNYVEMMVELGLVGVDGSGRWKAYEINC